MEKGLQLILILISMTAALAHAEQGVDAMKREAELRIGEHLCSYADDKKKGTCTEKIKCVRKGKRDFQSLCDFASDDQKESCLFDEADLSYRVIMLSARHDGDLEELKNAAPPRAQRRKIIDDAYIAKLADLIGGLRKGERLTSSDKKP